MIAVHDTSPAAGTLAETSRTTSALSLLDRVPAPCRVVAADGRVLWESSSLREFARTRAERGCCGSLGLRHTDEDCPSARALKTGHVQKQMRWLGRIHVAVESVPVSGLFGSEVVAFEYFRDVTSERRLEAALARQQSLLETINRAMIKINHNLEIAQGQLEEKNRSLEAANRQLRSLDQMKDEFISIVSHELKAPLTSIKGSVELIRACESEGLSATGTELLAVCQRNVHRLHRLVQDLLDIARIESGRLSLEFTRFDLRELTEECLASERAAADSKGIAIENHVPSGLQIEADRERLVQVLVNLVNNAVKFTDHGSVTVSARTENGGAVSITVQDMGAGIPQDEQSRIFDKFAQAGGDLHRNSGGTGLGLSIVRGIVREHGGEIRLTSQPGHGSCFTIILPQPPGKTAREARSPLD
ncbi:MAG: ATP-binding protein [bacterium]|nr:ATP-binding protein [bacterium]